MVVRRVAVAALGVVLSFVYASAQEGIRELSPDAVSNWTAPPYWNPVGEAGKNFGEVVVEGEELGIEPMGALPTAPLPFTAITPCRIVDTRNATGPFGGPALVANATRTFTIPSGPCAGIPSDAGAYSLNFTVIGGSGTFTNAFLTAWPTGNSQPTVSTLNFNANQLEANAGVVPAGTSGSINVFVNAPAHLLIDINGYYRNAGVVTTVNGLSGAVTLAAGSNVTVTPSGQTLTIASTGGGAAAAWSLTGNAGTALGTNFLGTTDGQSLELRVNAQRKLLLDTAGNIVGGASTNHPNPGAFGGVVGGGGDAASPNVIGGLYAVVGGGVGNSAGGYSTVPGGFSNTADGIGAFAAGEFAHAVHSGSFVWNDAAGNSLFSTGTNQFLVRATGGVVLLRTGSNPHGTGSALQVEHGGTNGEAAWLYTTNSGTTADVVRALKYPSATNNFFRCSNYDGTTVTNKCHIDANGAFTAGSDFAEALPARGGKWGFEPGDVLVASRDVPGDVEKSSRRYDTRVLGVYSTRPGFVGADKDGETRVDADDIPVAITGIVPTNVTAENGPIEPGDLLTTSSTPGFAMKATPVSVAGVEIYPTGTILGKALTPLTGEKGKIRMLVLPR